MMAAIDLLIAANYLFIAAEIKPFLLLKLQIRNSQVWAVLGGRKLHFQVAYGSYTFYQPTAELWHSFGS